MTIFPSLFHRIGAASLEALDSSGLFFPPMDVEAAIVILRRHSEIVWLLPFLATAGSLIGAAMAFWIGRKIGKNGLQHWISPILLESVIRKVRHKGAVGLVLPALLPPPFPLLPFVLASGALSVSATRFFIMFAGLRLVRFSILTALVWFYGRQILTMVQTGTFKTVMAVVVVPDCCGNLHTNLSPRDKDASTPQHLAAVEGPIILSERRIGLKIVPKTSSRIMAALWPWLEDLNDVALNVGALAEAYSFPLPWLFRLATVAENT